MLPFVYLPFVALFSHSLAGSRSKPYSTYASIAHEQQVNEARATINDKQSSQVQQQSKGAAEAYQTRILRCPPIVPVVIPRTDRSASNAHFLGIQLACVMTIGLGLHHVLSFTVRNADNGHTTLADDQVKPLTKMSILLHSLTLPLKIAKRSQREVPYSLLRSLFPRTINLVD